MKHTRDPPAALHQSFHSESRPRETDTESTSTDDTKSTMDLFTSSALWPSTEVQTFSPSSGTLATAAESSGSTGVPAGTQARTGITPSSVGQFAFSATSSQDDRSIATHNDVSSESSVIATSHAADETTAVSGLTQTSMFTSRTLSTPPTVMYSITAVPPQSLSLETSPISMEALSNSGRSSTVLSSSSSSSSPPFPLFVTASSNTITSSQPVALTTDVPFSADSQSSLNTVDSSSIVSVTDAAIVNVLSPSNMPTISSEAYSPGDSSLSTNAISSPDSESTLSLPTDSNLNSHSTDNAYPLTNMSVIPIVTERVNNTIATVSPLSESTSKSPTVNVSPISAIDGISSSKTVSSSQPFITGFTLTGSTDYYHTAHLTKELSTNNATGSSPASESPIDVPSLTTSTENKLSSVKDYSANASDPSLLSLESSLMPSATSLTVSNTVTELWNSSSETVTSTDYEDTLHISTTPVPYSASNEVSSAILTIGQADKIMTTTPMYTKAVNTNVPFSGVTLPSSSFSSETLTFTQTTLNAAGHSVTSESSSVEMSSLPLPVSPAGLSISLSSVSVSSSAETMETSKGISEKATMSSVSVATVNAESSFLSSTHTRETPSAMSNQVTVPAEYTTLPTNDATSEFITDTVVTPVYATTLSAAAPSTEDTFTSSLSFSNMAITATGMSKGITNTAEHKSSTSEGQTAFTSSSVGGRSVFPVLVTTALRTDTSEGTSSLGTAFDFASSSTSESLQTMSLSTTPRNFNLTVKSTAIISESPTHSYSVEMTSSEYSSGATTILASNSTPQYDTSGHASEYSTTSTDFTIQNELSSSSHIQTSQDSTSGSSNSIASNTVQHSPVSIDHSRSPSPPSLLSHTSTQEGRTSEATTTNKTNITRTRLSASTTDSSFTQQTFQVPETATPENISSPTNPLPPTTSRQTSSSLVATNLTVSTNEAAVTNATESTSTLLSPSTINSSFTQKTSQVPETATHEDISFPTNLLPTTASGQTSSSLVEANFTVSTNEAAETNATESTSTLLSPSTINSSFTQQTSQVPETATPEHISSPTNTYPTTTSGQTSSSLVTANFTVSNNEAAETNATESTSTVLSPSTTDSSFTQQTSQVPEAATPENISSPTNTLPTTTSGQTSSSLVTANLTVSAINEINGTQPTVLTLFTSNMAKRSTLDSAPTSAEYTPSVNVQTESADTFHTETATHSSTHHASMPSSAVSTVILHSTGTSSFVAVTTEPLFISTVSPLQTHTTITLQPGTITHSPASSTHFTSAFFPNSLTSSVITVPSSVSPRGMSTEASSQVAATTRISAPTSVVLNLTTAFSSTASKATQTVTELTHSTLEPVTLVRNTTTPLTSDSKHTSAISTPITAVPKTTSAPVNASTLATPLSTAHSTTITTPTQVVSTVHAPALTTTTTTVIAPDESTLSEMTKTSTAYQMTISAALTSITASAKETTLPDTTVRNTTAALTKTATATILKTTPSPPVCKLSDNILVKTVLVVAPKLMTSSNNVTQNISGGLIQALGHALSLPAQVQINNISTVDVQADSSLVTLGYFVIINIQNARLVYIPSAVTDALTKYGNSSFTADIKQYLPSLQYVSVLAMPWIPSPEYRFQLKTVLQFVDSAENVHSCSFVQTMEQRLQNAFQFAESKSLSTSNSNLTVQMVSTSLVDKVVTLIYAVRNQSQFINGTVSSNLLNLLSAELVGFYLAFPPLIIAESLEYPSISTAESTRNFWVNTVIQGVEDALLESQTFARLMEKRLAELFMISLQQGRRFRRATTAGAYTVQMVKIQRIQGPKNLVQLTYYALYNDNPLLGTTAAKQLNTIDSQTMALKLGYVVLVQADAVVNNPPNNMWIIAAVLAPIAVVTVIIIIITAVLCRKNKGDFKAETMANMPPRAKPVQGFDYAKQHLGQQGAEDDVLPVTQETVVPPLTMSQDRQYAQDAGTGKTSKSTETRKSQSPSENGSIMSNESGQPSSGDSTPQKVMAQQKVAKDDTRKRNGFKTSKKIVPLSDEEDGSIVYDNSAKMATDPFDTSSGSVQLIAIKPVGVPPSHPASDRSQESAVINGEVNKALKQKSDIEHYRNKLRLKAKKKGYYDFPPVDSSKSLTDRKRKMYEKKQKELDSVLDRDTDVSSPFAEPKNRQPPTKNVVYRSRQSLNSPSPGETEMDLLVTRERPRRGIRNSGYDTEPEIIEETNVDRVKESRRYVKSRHMKGHSETSTLSSQPSIDEVRQQMHMLLEEAFSLASAGHAGTKRQPETYSSAQQLPYSEVVTSAPGTMTRPRGGVQWVPTYGPETYQYSLPRPAYRFSQLPEMVTGSPPPPVPPRTGPVAVTSLRRSTSDIGSKTRIPEPSGTEQAQHDTVAFAPVLRNPVPVAPLDQSASSYSGDTVPAVFAIPANRTGFTGYFVPRPPAAYRNQAWVSYAGESELPGQWADSVPLPGYIDAYPRPHYQQNSPSRLPRQYSQPSSMHPSMDQAAVLSAAASQQSLADTDTPDTSLTNLSTAALVKAIREEVAKLARKQTDRFEFQV